MAFDEFMRQESDEDPVSLPNIFSSKDLMDGGIKKNLGAVPTYWDALYGNYKINAKREVREFISSKGDEFKKFLLVVPTIINKEFLNDELLLKISNNYRDQKLLKIYIKTSYTPQETAYKINKIEDEVFLIDNFEILNNLEISAEF